MNTTNNTHDHTGASLAGGLAGPIRGGHTRPVPEILEVEQYRQAAQMIVGRTIVEVLAPDMWFLKRGLMATGLRDALEGRAVSAVRRRGKLLLVDTDGPVLGLRFGMTGRLLVDGDLSIGALQYGPDRLDDAWQRFGLRFSPSGSLVIDDARRLGGVELEPDVDVLGPDALSLTRRQLAAALAGGRAPIKAALLDQHRVAGLGNLLVDEILWRAGLDPTRPAGSLAPDEVAELQRTLRRTLRQLARRGGSHTGDLQAARMPGAVCPRDGTPLERRTVGGRTTYSCPTHQR
jgi:formamidopyrimidine-DNA glycosylase